jgi:hypothetical protein
MKRDVTTMMAGAERLLETIENPRHRAILRNYRRHAMLEVSNRIDEIFSPEMTVEHPVYVQYRPDGTRAVLDGKAAVIEVFYGHLIKYGANVMILEDEHIAVADWGFASEYMSNDYITGDTARARGFDVDDLSAMYVHQHAVIMTWRYSDDCRLIGENVAKESAGTLSLLAPDEIITIAEAHRALAPLIGPPPPRYDYHGNPLPTVAMA